MSRNPKQPGTLTEDELVSVKASFVLKINKMTGIRPYEKLTDDCWDWKGSCEKSGSGIWQTDLCKKLNITKTHRLSMYLFKPDEWNWQLDVLHACDRPQCVNPAHLRMGTQTDNNKDRDERKRQVALKGPANGFAKFNDEQITQIKLLREKGTNYEDIALRYGCNRRTIERICLGKTGYSSEPIIAPTRYEIIEPQIIKLLKDGKKVFEICAELNVSSATVAKATKATGFVKTPAN